MPELTAPALAPAVADVRGQLATLVGPGFVTATGAQRLPDLTRYLQAIERWLAKLPRDPDRDRDRMHQVEAVTQEYHRLRDDIGDGPQLQQIRWMIEELRVSYYSGAAHPVPGVRQTDLPGHAHRSRTPTVISATR